MALGVSDKNNALAQAETPGAGLVSLNKREQQALAEILISSKSRDGLPKQRVMRVLRTRDEGVFEMFLRKVRGVAGDAFKVVYDEQSNRCFALARANAKWTQEVLDNRHLALLLFCFYLGMTSKTGRMTFDELHGYLQRSSLYAERKLINALDHLVKCGFLRMEEFEGEEEEKKRAYRLTEMGRQAFPPSYLMRVLSESQGGEVSMEQVYSFFNLNQRAGKQEDEEIEQFSLF